MAKGWHNEPRRHALASKGIKTATNPVNRVPLLQNTMVFNGLDEWGRKTYIMPDGRILKEVDGVLHTTTKQGEPDMPYRPMTRKWDGSTDSGSQYSMLRQKGYGHEEAVAYIERDIKPERFIGEEYDDLSPNDKIRFMLKNLKQKGIISEESTYDAKGVYIKWNDGDISGTSDKGKRGLEWLQSRLKSEINDSDGDGLMDDLDCDPTNPTKQGFFDKLKSRIQETREEKVERQTKERQEKIAKLRKEAEEKEEKLEAEKEAKLLKLKSQVAEKKALAEIKAKEAELDNLQEEIEQLSGKSERKLFIESTKKRLGKTLSRAKQRLIQEIKETPGRRTSIDLSKEELELTSPSKLKALKEQQKKNANKEAALALKKLEEQEDNINKQLEAMKEKKAKK